MEHPVEKLISDHGALKIAQAIGVPAATVRMWKLRKRIPAERWRDLADCGLATLDQLADAAKGAAA